MTYPETARVYYLRRLDLLKTMKSVNPNLTVEEAVAFLLYQDGFNLGRPMLRVLRPTKDCVIFVQERDSAIQTSTTVKGSNAKFSCDPKECYFCFPLKSQPVVFLMVRKANANKYPVCEKHMKEHLVQEEAQFIPIAQ